MSAAPVPHVAGALVGAAAFVSTVLAVAPTPDQEGASTGEPVPVELGRVDWVRDLDRGIERSRETGKPILLMFQEVPGCEACVHFGETALSHPLLVDTIEAEYVPVCILNSVEGADREVLDSFGEAPWNFQSLRVIDAERKDLVKRTDTLRTPNMLALWLEHGFEARDREVPKYLAVAVEETYREDHPQRFSVAAFAMHCYWVGEQKLGGIDGVVATRAGWIGDREVVEVDFDHTIVPYEKLLASAAELDCLDTIYAYDHAQSRIARKHHDGRVEELVQAPRGVEAKEQFHQLRLLPLGHLPLTVMQQTKLNAAVVFDAEGRPSLPDAARAILTPGQLALLARFEVAAPIFTKAYPDSYPPVAPGALATYADTFEQHLVLAEGLICTSGDAPATDGR
ncbi:MAG: VPGUxxT family thioredoxin-like (seleno)protein, type 2 [Planctomycetota bacterium]